jgi:hypothetical protein
MPFTPFRGSTSKKSDVSDPEEVNGSGDKKRNKIAAILTRRSCSLRELRSLSFEKSAKYRLNIS